ncbi:MAG: hypothetical protein QXD03_04705 [Candidatus Anstonellales archaeon]
MEGLIPSIYDIEFWKNIAVFSIGISAILTMILFRVISDIKSKIDVIIKQMDNINRKFWFDDDTEIVMNKKSKLYKIIDEGFQDDQ